MAEVPTPHLQLQKIRQHLADILAKLDNPTDPQITEILAGKTFQTATIHHNTSGDNIIVSAVAGKKIKVYAIVVNFAGTVSAKWKSGTNDLTGAMSFQDREGYTIAVDPPASLFETNQGEALVLNLSGAVYADGWLAYWDDDAS